MVGHSGSGAGPTALSRGGPGAPAVPAIRRGLC
ncbi:hypothetical protein ABH930_001557 [Kitasatospora sp. GAS204A]